jgi:hypothetical protein
MKQHCQCDGATTWSPFLNDRFLIFDVCDRGGSGSNYTDRRVRREQLGAFDDFLLIFGEMRRIPQRAAESADTGY